MTSEKMFYVLFLVLLGGTWGSAALADPVRLHVHVTKERDGTDLGGAQIVLRCDPAHVLLDTRTSVHGWGHLEFGFAMTPVDPGVPGPLQLSPTPRPNPLQGEGVVTYLRPVAKSATDGALTLYDLRGRVVVTGQLGDEALEIPAGGAPAGVYLLRCLDRADGTRSDCRIVASGGPLRRLRLLPIAGDAAYRLPPTGFQAKITIHYPGSLDREIDMMLYPGDQDLAVALTSVAGDWPAENWLFAANHGWNTAAVDSGWIPALADTGLVFNHRMIDTDGTRHALAQWNGAQISREYCADNILEGRSSQAFECTPPIAPVIYFDFSDIPAGATIEQAWLIVWPLTWSKIPWSPGVSHAATLDIWPGDAAWLEAPPSVTCGVAQGGEHWRRTSWQFADVANEIAWNPPMSARRTWDEFGIHSERVTHEIRGGHACRYDVTRALQIWSDNREVMANAGFVMSNWRPFSYYYLAAGAHQAVANQQPMLVVTVSERPRTLPWRGHALVFSFGTDDGDSANVHYMEACENHGVRLTAFVMRQGVREFYNNNPQKLSIAQWRDLVARGHEVGHHSDHHPGTWGLAEIAWGQQDSMNVELARGTWLDQVFGDDGQTAGAVDVLAYPAGGVSLWAIKNLVNHDFVMGRCAGGTEYWGLPTWGNSGMTTYLSWNDPVNLFNIAVTAHFWLVGEKRQDVTLDDIRANLRRVTADMLNQGQAALITFCHSTKNALYSNGVDYDELDMLLTAIQETGLYWIGTHGELAHCYREAHVPVAPGDGIGHSAYDSLLTAGHQEFAEVWWVLPEGSR